MNNLNMLAADASTASGMLSKRSLITNSNYSVCCAVADLMSFDMCDNDFVNSKWYSTNSKLFRRPLCSQYNSEIMCPFSTT